MNALIIDDEKQAREGVKILLKSQTGVQVLDEARDGEEAIEKIRDLRPDLIFLDVQMPGINGFDVLGNLMIEPLPIVIFITAYDKYALKAFEVQALDYLLKPLSRERFMIAIGRAEAHMKNKSISDHEEKLKKLIGDYQRDQNDEQLINNRSKHQMIVKASGKIHFINTVEVVWVEAMDSYVKIHLKEKTHIVKASLQSIEKRYPHAFIRIHRSHLINMGEILFIEPSFNGDFFVTLKGKITLKGSRKFRTNLPEVL